MSSFAIFFCMLLAIPIQLQAQDIVIKACNRALNKAVCQSTLATAPNKAGKKAILEFALNLLSTTGNEITKQLGNSTDPAAKKAISDCTSNYSSAMDQIKEAQAAAEDEKYNDANIKISAAMTAADTCGTGFKETAAKSPVSDLNTKFSQQCSIILAITNV